MTEDCFTDKLLTSDVCQLFKSISKLTYDTMSSGKQSFNSTVLPKEYHGHYLAETLTLFTVEARTTSLEVANVL